MHLVHWVVFLWYPANENNLGTRAAQRSGMQKSRKLYGYAMLHIQREYQTYIACAERSIHVHYIQSMCNSGSSRHLELR